MPWLVDGVFVQTLDEPLSSLPVLEAARPARFVHFLNPFRGGTESDNSLQRQRLTFETIRRAHILVSQMPVHLGAVVAEGEEDCVPDGFALAGTLSRTVADIADFAHPSPLPLLFDVLEKGCEYAGRVANEHGDDPGTVFVIFTSVDICLMPHFYDAVAKLVARGFDSLTINRRGIPEYEPLAENLPTMYSEHGIDHPGFDCVVFPLNHFARFVRSDACIGRDLAMRSLLYNMVANSRRMALLRKAHLTFHLGGTGKWVDPKYKDYTAFNAAQAKRVIVALAQRDRAIALKLAEFCTRHREPFQFEIH